MRPRFRSITKIAAVAMTMVLAASACGDDGNDDDGGNGGAGGSKDITIGMMPGWAEGEAATYLWQHILEEQGYNVTVDSLEVGPLFTGLSQGNMDVFLDAWLPSTHEDYWNQYGEQLEQIAAWYEDAPLTIAVPEYSDLRSLEDLKGKAGEYDGEIVGIESSSGLYRVSSGTMLEEYNLQDEWEVVPSSSSAMLSELKNAVDNEEKIVVTLWRPHWAYEAYPIRDLEDPEGAMGEPDSIYSVGREGFGEDFPEVEGWLKNFKMNDEQLGSLENLLQNEYKDNPDEGVDAWVNENPDYVQSVTG